MRSRGVRAVPGITQFHLAGGVPLAAQDEECSLVREEAEGSVSSSVRKYAYLPVRRVDTGSMTGPDRRMDSQVLMASSLVYFEGAWSSEETAIIEAAAEEAEAMASTRVPCSPFAPWVALAYPRRKEGTYLASRHGRPMVLRADSAEALAGKIRRFGREGQRAVQ